VLAWQDTMRPADLERFAALRIPVFVAKPLSILDVGRLYGTIEQLSGVRSPEPLRQFHEKLRRSLHKLDKPAVKVFLEVWHQPLTTIAGPHWMNEALAFCGATNAFQDLAGVAPVVSWEALYARDPRVIVGAGSARDAATFRAQWRDRATLDAVKNDRLVFVD